MLQTPEEGGNVIVRRACVIRAESEHVPTFDASRLAQPQAYVGALLAVLQLHDSNSAAAGQQVFDSFSCMGETIGVAKKVRSELGASQPAASFLQDIAFLPQVSQEKAVRSMDGRATFASK